MRILNAVHQSGFQGQLIAQRLILPTCPPAHPDKGRVRQGLHTSTADRCNSFTTAEKVARLRSLFSPLNRSTSGSGVVWALLRIRRMCRATAN